MSPRRRGSRKRGWPANLYERGGYYSWRNPVTREEFGIGRDRAAAFEQAIEARKGHSLPAARLILVMAGPLSFRRREPGAAVIQHDLALRCGPHVLLVTAQELGELLAEVERIEVPDELTAYRRARLSEAQHRRRSLGRGYWRRPSARGNQG